MKTSYRILLVAFLSFLLGSALTFATAPAIQVLVNGKKLNDVKIIGNQVYVNLKLLSEQLNATFSYNNKTKTYLMNSRPTLIPVQVTPLIITVTATPEIMYVTKPTTLPTRTPASTVVPVATQAPSITQLTPNVTPISTITANNVIKTTVSRVVDGDTIEAAINGKTEKIRLIGVDTPETVDPKQGIQPYGKEASDYTKQRLLNQAVEIELDIDDRDFYGRILGYVWLNGKMYNTELIQNGYAVLMTISPNVKYVDLFKRLQEEARNAKHGLWAGQASPTTVPSVQPTVIPIVTPSPTIQPTIEPVATPSVTFTPVTEATPQPTIAPAPLVNSVNINTASASELQSIPGIGPSLAQKIISYRQTNGNFTSTSQLINVSGIGPTSYQKMAPYVRVN